MLRLIALSGVPGVGKSETARQLLKLCPSSAVLVELDSLGHIHPWSVGEVLFSLISMNLSACVENAHKWGARFGVIEGVIAQDGLFPHLLPLLHDPSYTWSLYELRASLAVVESRVRSSPDWKDSELRLHTVRNKPELGKLPDAYSIDTSHLVAAQVAEMIAEREGWRNADALG